MYFRLAYLLYCKRLNAEEGNVDEEVLERLEAALRQLIQFTEYGFDSAASKPKIAEYESLLKEIRGYAQLPTTLR